MTTSVVALDGLFPQIGAESRIAEFGALLERHTIDAVMSSVANLHAATDAFAQSWPHVADRVTAYEAARLAEFDLAYLVTLDSAMAFLPDLRAERMPCVVTLYPGGGLELGSDLTNRRLDELWASDLVQGVITTQPGVTQYLHDRFADAIAITEVAGMPVGREFFAPGPGRRTDYFGSGKQQLDLCFVSGGRASVDTRDALDVFVKTVRSLRAAGLEVQGHVVGELPATRKKLELLTLHGTLSNSAFRDLLSRVDMLVAPRHVGADKLDRFPSISAVQGALCGAALLCSGDLTQNSAFRDGRSILIEPADADRMSARIQRLVNEPGGIARVAQAGLAVARRQYSEQVQLEPRERALREADARRVDERELELPAVVS